MRRDSSPRNNVYNIVYRQSIVIFHDVTKVDRLTIPKERTVPDEDG